MRTYLILIIIAMVVTNGCSSGNQSKDGLPTINVKKKYPVKEIVLSDIADVTYVHLNTENEDYLYRGAIRYISENSIVVVDISLGSILFFSKDGNPKSRFNRYGEGPEEYSNKNFFIVYDEAADDVFVNATGRITISDHSIPVYSSTGEYKRKLILPACPTPLVNFDNQSLFVYDMQNQYKKITGKSADLNSQLYDSSYYRIAKTDGEILEYVNFPNNKIDLTDRGPTNKSIQNYNRIVNSVAGLFLCNPESDTIFLYNKDKTLTPVICKTPLVSKLNPKIVMSDFVEVERYQFIQVQTLFDMAKMLKIQWEEQFKYYMYDKQTGEIFRQKIILPDYIGKEFVIRSHLSYFVGNEMLMIFDLNLFELKQAYRENKLSGELKTLVATLDETKDNEVYVFARFKE